MTTSLWAEVTIAGFIYLVAAIFFALRLLGLQDLKIFEGLKDYVTIVSVVGIGLSYILGILFHRLVPIIISPVLQLVARVLGRKDQIQWTKCS